MPDSKDNSKEIIIADEQAMMDFGASIADQFPRGGMILLHGDLGAGKTTLVRGLLRHLGFQGTVKSPTYTLVEPYDLTQIHAEKSPDRVTGETMSERNNDPQAGVKSHKNRGGVLFNGQVYHFDLYRLGDPEELEYMGGRDYWQNNTLCLIEWPEKAQGYLPEADLEINIHHAGDARRVKITNGEIDI